MNTATVCQRAGISYRQADYWVRAGIVPGVSALVDRGSGQPREWTHSQYEFVAVLAQLIRAGINPRIAAAAIQERTATGTALSDLTEITLPGGLTVNVRPRLQAVTA